MSLFEELKRRNVFRVAITYLVGSWLLLQVGDVLFDFIDAPDWAGKLLLAFLALGFVPALVIAWAYELTPEGIKREAEIDRSKSVTHHTARKLDLITIALVLAGVGFLLIDRFVLDGGFDPAPVDFAGVRAEFPAEIGSDPALETALTPSKPTDAGSKPASPSEKSIAVLPFVNMSSDPEQEYFSDGLAETLLHMLAQIGELRVAARTSSFQFKGHTGDVAEIAEKLKVANVLEGSVRRAGNTVRITAQLIKADDGFHLWSGTYDREMDNIFAIQDEIAGAVVEALKLTLLDSPSKLLAGDSTDNLDAYEEYLKGRQQLTHFSYQSLPAAEAHFRRAIELDTDYLLAHIALAESYILMGNTGKIAFAESAKRIAPLAERILELDPDSGPGQVILGWAEFGRGSSPRDVEPVFRRAWELAPQDDFVALQYATILRWGGQAARSAQIGEEALARDPMSPLLHLHLASAYNALERYDKALFHARQVQTLDPDSPNGYGEMAETYDSTGRFVEAVQTLEKAIAIDPNDFELPAEIAMDLLAVGAVAEASKQVSKALEMRPQGLLPIAGQVALLYRQGDYEGAGRTALEAIVADPEPRRWGVRVFILAIREYALRSGNPKVFIDHVPAWLDADLSDPTMTDPRDAFVKLISAPVLQSAGQHELADTIAENARTRDRGPRAGQPDWDLAIARRDPDAAIEALRWRLRHGIDRDWWLYLDSVTLDFLKDDPRLKSILSEIEAEVAAQREILIGTAG